MTSKQEQSNVRKTLQPHMWVLSRNSTGSFLVSIGDPRKPSSKLKLVGDRNTVREWVKENVGTRISADHVIDATGMKLVPETYSKFYADNVLKRGQVKNLSGLDLFELVYSTGGTGGPYPSESAAKEAAQRYMDGFKHERWVAVITAKDNTDLVKANALWVLKRSPGKRLGSTAGASTWTKGPQPLPNVNPVKHLAAQGKPLDGLADLDPFTLQYIQTALWSSNDESDDSGGRPLDDNYSEEDLSEEALSAIKRDCEKFQKENWKYISKNEEDLEQAGHDFWLTRNGHGVGFWDGDYWPEDVGEILTKSAKKFGEQHLYVGDDGKIHAG